MAKTISVPARLANFGFGETQVFSKNGCLTSLTVEEYFGELQEPQAKQACDSIAEKMNVPKKTPL